MKKCIYCENNIIEKSKEHVIHNALGGLYESEDICCPKCNTYISKSIDVPFTKIFSPIVANIDKLKKTHNTKSQQSFNGIAQVDGKLYDVLIKGKKVVACLELSREYKCDISKFDFKVLGYSFDVNSNILKQGFAKIALNFAIDKGVLIKDLKDGIDAEIDDKGNLTKVKLNYPVIPFVALNPIDRNIELESELELYHNLILFSMGNTLWCYVDLFNTFQYYVCLSQNYESKKEVSEVYFQLVQKINRDIPNIRIRRPKDVLIYAQAYGVKADMNLEKFKKSIEDKIQKESQVQSMSKVISKKLTWSCIGAGNERITGMKNLLLYFDKDDNLNESTFRRVLESENIIQEVLLYPFEINRRLTEGEDIRWYTYAKFERLNRFLTKES